MTDSLLFVGESPPASAASDFAPFDCASGTRLASALGLMSRATLLAHVRMANLFDRPTGVAGAPVWVDAEARKNACNVLVTDKRASAVCLGRRVADAFDMPRANGKSNIPAVPLLTSWRHEFGPLITYVPHPSGASPVFNSPATRTEIRQAILPEMVLGCATLRPWHFRLDDPSILQDLAVAVAPTCPAVGAAALLWARAQHLAREVRISTPLLARVDMATAAASSATTSPRWATCTLRHLAAVLLTHDGARTLASAWLPGSNMGGNAGDKYLLKAAEDHDHVTASASRMVSRATRLRYHLAGLGE